MICHICQGILTVEPLHDGLVPEKPHHRTGQSFKRSVKLGCYICNTLWQTLNPGEKGLILSVADSGQHSLNNGTGAGADGSPEDSGENLITVSWLGDSSIQGWPGRYHLDVGVDAGTVFTPEWRARYLLQPHDGMFIA